MATPFQNRRTVVLLGDKDVGKTTLIEALRKKGKATPTAGPSDIHEVAYKGIKISMVDVAGESMKSVTPNTIRYARVVLLVYDITKHATLDSCKYWHEFAKHNCREEAVSYALVGCKLDLVTTSREVAWDTAERVSKMINASELLEVSAEKGTHCDQLMDWLYGIMKEVQDADKVDDESVRVEKESKENGPTKSCWC